MITIKENFREMLQEHETKQEECFQSTKNRY